MLSPKFLNPYAFLKAISANSENIFSPWSISSVGLKSGKEAITDNPLIACKRMRSFGFVNWLMKIPAVPNYMHA